VRVEVGKAVDSLAPAVEVLLTRARDAGTVRADVGLAEVLALLGATGQGALVGGWDQDLQRRTLAVIHAGLRP
jgi:hypothetical protein